MKNKHRLIALFLILLFTVQGFLPAAAANYIEAQTDYFRNSNAFYNDGEYEFYSNSEDEDKLYRIDLASGEEVKVSDEHVITLADFEGKLLLSVYNDGASDLLEFDPYSQTSSLVCKFGGIVNNFSVKDKKIYYPLDGAIFAYSITEGTVVQMTENQNIDLIYFSDAQTLKYYVRQDNGEYAVGEYSFSKFKKFTEKQEVEVNLPKANSLYTPRLTAPSTTDPYYTTDNPFSKTGYGMVKNNGNCTCYAYGRSYENLKTKPNLCLKDAGQWYDYNIEHGYYEYGSKPYLGAVVVWNKKGSAGHVAVVEVIDGTNVITSESGWKSFYFRTVTRSTTSKNLSASSGYNLLGYIYVIGKLTNEPPVAPVLTQKKEVYKLGETTTITWNASAQTNYYSVDIVNGAGTKVVSQNVALKQTYSVALPSDTYTATVSATNYSGTSKTSFNFVIYNDLGSQFCANIINGKSGLCLTNNGDNAELWKKTDSLTQDWKFVKQTNGSYRITSEYNSKALVPQDISGTAATDVMLDFPHDKAQECWYLVGDEKTGLRIINSVVSGYALDPEGGSTVDGTNIRLYRDNYTVSQTFKVETVTSSALSAPSITKSGKVTLSWGSVRNASSYYIYIFNKQKGLIKSQSLGTERTVTLDLPIGGYTAYIAAVNSKGQSMGWIDFTVEANHTRLYGNSRYDTAIDISDCGWDKAETVVLANGLNYADALAGVPLAAQLNAPILLTAGKATLEASVRAEIDALEPTKILILGGAGVISEAIEKELSKTYLVERVFGTSRYDTAIEISKRVTPAPAVAVIVTGTGYADALSISPYAAINELPILYSNPSTGLSEDTQDYLASASEIIIIGGQGAVGAIVEEQLGYKSFNRIFGTDRYKTSYEIVKTFSSDFNNDVMLATGANFPDALAGGVLAAKLGTPLLLTHPNGLIAEIKNYILDKNSENIYILGGVGAVPDSVISGLYS